MVELLSPAGSLESLKVAVECGCDAVYIGGKKYSARNYASNFDDISSACDYCHLRGVKLYLAVNTLIKDNELSDFFDYVKYCYDCGVDAFIVQDLGAAIFLKKHLPNIVLHASTQMTAYSSEAADFLFHNGFKRVVLARELSLNEIQKICRKSDIEIECFIHGALCVCYSGQCLMSSVAGKRSGNRGRCAQPCRLKYDFYSANKVIKDGYLLSTCDLSSVSFLPSIIKSGIHSLKIEGRMKSMEYVSGVTYIYRKYIDLFFSDPQNYKVDDADIRILMQLFNRGGFSKGSFFNLPTAMSVQKPKHWGVYLGVVQSVKNNTIFFKTNEDIIAGDGIEIWDYDGNSCGSFINKNYSKNDIVAVCANATNGSFVYKTYDKLLYDSLKRHVTSDTRKISINGKFIAKIGSPCTFELNYNNLSVTADGNVVTEAVNSPLNNDIVRKQLCKTGSTTFFIQNIDIYIDENCFLNIADLNSIRRNACNLLASRICKRNEEV